MEKLVKKKLKYGELTNLVLETMADILIESNWLRRPSITIMLGKIIKIIAEERRRKLEQSQINKAIKDLEKRDLFYIEKKDKQVLVHLKEKGRIKLLKYSLERLLDFKKKNKKWDRRWFLVFFDIPEIQRNKRDYLRKFLTQLGFYRYQKSVYLFPYECEEEIKLIKKIVEGGKYIKYIVAEKIEDESALKTFFSL